MFCLFLTESRLLFTLITDIPTIQRLQCYPLQVSWLILLAPVVEPQQENDCRGAEQFVPNRDATNNRRRPAHGYHQHTCHNMNRHHKNLVLVHIISRNTSLKCGKIVYVDMDNVLVDFQSGLDRVPSAVKAEYADDGTGEPHYDEIPGIFSLMDPMPGAIKAMQELNKFFDLYILSTAPWLNPSAWCDKLEWV